MSVTEARLAANRANAQKSTGPKTDEGKERSRSNAVKHGLTGAGIAISDEEAAAIERRLAGFEADLRPKTEEGKALTRRAAVLSIRLERCAVQEAAAISVNVRAAEADFDEARAEEVDALFGMIEEEPAVAVRKLRRMPEGVDRMVAAWTDLRADLALGEGTRWGPGHSALALRLTGRKPGGFGIARVEALAKAASGTFGLLGPEDGPADDPRGRRAWARQALLALIDAEVAELEAHRETLDLERIAADRAGASARALFDPSKAATLARKYEAAAGREFHRALREVRAIEAEAAGREASPPLPAPPLASFSQSPAPRPPAPAPGPATPAQSPRFGPIEAATYVPFTIGRLGSGRG